MKIQILFLFAVILTSSLIANSYAQSNPPPFLVFVQTQIRNSDGQIVAYVEANKIAVLEPQILQKMLDVQPVRSTTTRGGQEFELIQVVVENPITVPETYARTALGTVMDGNEVLLAYYSHDGFLVVPGDTITSVWSVIRPVR